MVLALVSKQLTGSNVKRHINTPARPSASKQTVATPLVSDSNQDEPLIIKSFCRKEDPELATKAAQTMCASMSGDGHTYLFCETIQDYQSWWWGIALNYQLEMPQTPFIHSLGDDARCTSYCYIHPVEKPEAPCDSEQPEAEGMVDMAALARPGSRQLLKDMSTWLDEGRDEFVAKHGSFNLLAFLIVHPDHQRKGYGGKMLQHLTGISDSNGLWTYLEASNDSNARLYQKFGFQFTGRQRTFSVPDYEPEAKPLTLRIMTRPPRTLQQEH